MSGQTEGLAEAQADLTFGGDLYIYDNDGLPIDPIAVMSAFNALMVKFQLLQTGTATGTPALGTALSSLLPTADVQLRLVNPDGSPYTGSGLANLTPLTGGQIAGVNTITASGTAVTVQTGTDIVFGPANGRLTNTFTPPTLPSGITLQRDFYTLRVVGLAEYLVGAVPVTDPSFQCQPAPDVRVNEGLTLLTNGNDVMGAVGSVLTCVGQSGACCGAGAGRRVHSADSARHSLRRRELRLSGRRFRRRVQRLLRQRRSPLRCRNRSPSALRGSIRPQRTTPRSMPSSPSRAFPRRHRQRQAALWARGCGCTHGSSEWMPCSSAAMGKAASFLLTALSAFISPIRWA